MQNATDILSAILQRSDKHVLNNAPDVYRRRFGEAAVRVYPTKDLAMLEERNKENKQRS